MLGGASSLQPTSSGGGQALLRSFATSTQRRTVELPGQGPATVRSYDQHGRLVAEARFPSGTVTASVAPGGFTVATR